MDQDQYLRSPECWQIKRRPLKTLGGSIEDYINRRLPEFNRNSAVVEAWNRLLPEQFHKHCRLMDIASGILTVQAEPGPFMHQMQMSADELIREINRMCGRKAVKKIRFFPLSREA